MPFAWTLVSTVESHDPRESVGRLIQRVAAVWFCNASDLAVFHRGQRVALAAPVSAAGERARGACIVRVYRLQRAPDARPAPGERPAADPLYRRRWPSP